MHTRSCEAGSYLRLIDSCITQLKAQGPSRPCNERKEEEEGEAPAHARFRLSHFDSGFRVFGFRISGFGFQVSGFRASFFVFGGFRVSGFRTSGFQVSGFGFAGFWFLVSGFRVSGFGFWGSG